MYFYEIIVSPVFALFSQGSSLYPFYFCVPINEIYLKLSLYKIKYTPLKT